MRPAPLVFGCAVLAAIWSGPVDALPPGAFSAHMARHMGLVAIAAPALAFAIAGTRLDPVRGAGFLFPPLLASVAELIVVWVWHAPGPHHWARGSSLGFALEQATFLASGSWLWLAALGGDASRRGERAGQGALALLLTSMHMTLLGALLALPLRPLYHVHHQAARALDDQHVGGAIMLVVGGAVYLAGSLWLARELLRRESAEGRTS